MRYLIWSYRHRMWYRPEAAGYTDNVLQAGTYGRTEAGMIATSGLPGACIPVDEQLAAKLNGLTRDEVEAQLEEWRRI